MQTISLNTLPARFAARARDSHKGDFGSVGVLGGAPGMAGAALLAGRAALYCGTGRVYVGALDDRLAVDPVCPELMLVTAENLPVFSGVRSCLVIGPGLGNSSRARHLLEASLQAEHALLLDADALNWLARDRDLLRRLPDRHAPTLITPHPGEAARLLEQDTQTVQADRTMAIQRLGALTGATVVLKGADSLVLHPGGKIWRNSSGNPGMAAPGMGDVLAGIIAALLVQGLSAEQAAVLGVWLHGQAGDEAVANGAGPVGLTASEVNLRARKILNRTGST
jgi:hydroxyethylthiazole kinase-like uncharacterized protein yjeF